jgi:hypothetical protein
MRKIIALIAGWLARACTKDWALRCGLDRTTAALLSWLAGTAASAAIMRA